MENAKNWNSLYSLARKIRRAIFRVFFLIDLVVFIAFLPALLIMAIILAFKKSFLKQNKIALFVGLEHVIDKTVNRAKILEKNGIKSIYFSFEKTGNRSNDVSDNDVYKSYIIPLTYDIFKFIYLLIRYNPVYVEMYFEGTGINQLLYAIITKIAGILTISIFRGGELYYFKPGKFSKTDIRTYLCAYTSRISDFTYYREIYMEEYFDLLKVPKNKLVFDFNRVPVMHDEINYKKEPEILFLNGIKKWRRVELLVEAISIVQKENSNFNLTIVGCRNEAEFKIVSDEISKYQITVPVSIEYWTNTPHEYYNRATIFVLPADLIYCNFSLLEAMERGLPAIVSNVADADKIITNGVNGFLVDQEANAIAEKIMEFLNNDDLRIKMGINARNTIIEKYNDKDRMTPIIDLIRKKIQ